MNTGKRRAPQTLPANPQCLQAGALVKDQAVNMGRTHLALKG